MILAGSLVKSVVLLLLAPYSMCQMEPLPSTGFENCKALITAGLKDVVFLPTDPAYDASLTYYWSADSRAVKPSCFVQPRSTEEVANAIRVLSKTSGVDDVAIRSGGHSFWPSNNVAGGVTFDLSLLNHVVYSGNTKIASIGPGAMWGPVLLELEKYNRTVTSGRVGDVGVGGLLLGGGLSFYTGKHGVASNTVANFEVVLANGSVIDANARENPGLFKSLKGGSNNFGIVTRFDMLTFDATPGGIYAGPIFCAYDQKEAMLNAFVRLVDINEQNPADTTFFVLGYTSPGPASATMVEINIDGVENSTSFAPLRDLPAKRRDVKRQTYGEYVTKYTQEAGFRKVWFSLCFKNDVDIMNKAASLWEELTATAESASLGDGWSVNLIFQPLAKFYGQIGGDQNVLGLDKSLKHDSVNWLADATLSTPEQEAYLLNAIKTMTEKLEAYAVEKGGDTQWLYLNYVNPLQKPLQTYGEDNVRLMKDVAAQYDPEGFFQKRASAGFKISKVDDIW
ncbi:FAD binding domain-containing protein [Apiospora arundinis]|uniref:FAD binding domain-containing protein n=1 Tax=Apiospora arundinis TaxID=335852 RepID=A0ABR2I0S5_9PEZI